MTSSSVNSKTFFRIIGSGLGFPSVLALEVEESALDALNTESMRVCFVGDCGCCPVCGMRLGEVEEGLGEEGSVIV